MNQNELVMLLKSKFPSGYYEHAELKSILKKNQMLGDLIISFIGGNSTEEWLGFHGLRPLEKRMRSRFEDYPLTIRLSSQEQSELRPLLTEAFYKQPLIGNIQLEDRTKEKLHDLARKIIWGSVDSGEELSIFESDVLVLSTVVLLRNWNETDESFDNSEEKLEFWEYIYEQYALNHHDETQKRKIYRIFRDAINRSLTKHNKLYAKTGKKYYTSLLTHALAPRDKFNILFEQVFDYYSKTLQYQIPEDNKFSKDQAFNAFSFAMYEKITGKESNREKDVRIKSMQSSSAIKMLFTQCPYYMGFFVKSLIQEMDLLVSAGEISEDTYINSLLKEWYENRTFIDRGGDKSKRDESRKVRTITDHTQIRLEYMLENEEVFISIPSIHLGKAQEKSPEIAFYQDSNCIYKDDLKSYGEKFYMVSSKTKIPLKKVLQKPADLFTLEARISYGEKQIYQSKDKLYRTALVFNDLGVEIKKRPDEGEFFYLFTSINAYIDDLLYESPQCNLCYQDDKTQLYRVLMGRDTQVIIDGENLFPIILQDEDLTIKLWNEPIPQIVYNIAGKEYKIFSAQPRIFFDVKDSDKKYMVSIDGEKEPLARYFDKNSKQWEILLPDQSCHELRIYDNSLNKEIFDFFYIVLPKLNIQHEGFYFPLSNEIGTFTLTDENINITKSYSLLPQESSMVIPYLDGELVIDIPRVDCLYNGEQMSSIKSEVMWYEDISQSDTLEIAAPNNLKITFLVGDKSFSCSKIEIGNLIQSINKEEKIIPISCILTSNTKESNITIFKVALRPYFVTTPVKIENGRLTWFPESFIGNRDTNFTLVLRKKRKEIYNQSFSLMDEIIAEGISFEEGVYEAEIYAISPGIFSKKELIGTYRLVVGCHFKFRFEDSLINLTAATIDTKEIPLNEDSGIITDLVYLGKQKLNGEILSYPCYKGCLNWRNNYGDLRPYSSKEGLRVKNNKRINYLAVNPVKVWIINDYTLSLRDQDNDGLYVHKEWRSITDRNYRSKYEEEKYTNPDYYLYKTERIEDV